MASFFIKTYNISRINMKLSLEEKQRLENIYQTFSKDERILKMKEIPMHRGSNCYEHSFKVAKKAIKNSIRLFKKNIDLEVVLIGAILHDYYLYDWRSDRERLKGHAKNHEMIASENASRDFGVPPEIKKVIESHMWPFNFKSFPNTREAKIVSFADKSVATSEAFTSVKYKKKKRETYIKYISTLF